MAINPVCPLCLEDIETNDHIFKDCHSTIKIWQSAIQHEWLLAYTKPKNNFDIYQWLVKIKNHKQPKVLQQTAFLLWSIWKHMNAIVFRNDIFKPLTCLIRAKKAYGEWRIRTCMSTDDVIRGSNSPLCPPPITLKGGTSPSRIHQTQLRRIAHQQICSRRLYSPWLDREACQSRYGALWRGIYPYRRSLCSKKWCNRSYPSWLLEYDYWRR